MADNNIYVTACPPGKDLQRPEEAPNAPRWVHVRGVDLDTGNELRHLISGALGGISYETSMERTEDGMVEVHYESPDAEQVIDASEALAAWLLDPAGAAIFRYRKLSAWRGDDPIRLGGAICFEVNNEKADVKSPDRLGESVQHIYSRLRVAVAGNTVLTLRADTLVAAEPRDDFWKLYERVQFIVRQQPIAGVAADIAHCILMDVAGSIGRAERDLNGWLRRFERDIFDARHDKLSVRLGHLARFQRNVHELLDEVSAIDVLGVEGDADRAWFPGGDPSFAILADRRLTDEQARLSRLSDAVRDSVMLASTVASAAQAEGTERLSRIASYATALVLVPTLVAGALGASFASPPLAGHWSGVGYVACAMSVSAIVSVAIIRLTVRRPSRSERPLNPDSAGEENRPNMAPELFEPMEANDDIPF